MTPTPPADGPVRPDAAELNARIRALAGRRRWWTREELAEWRGLQAAYLAATRDEERLGRGDVTEVA